MQKKINSVKFVDFVLEYKEIKKELNESLKTVFERGNYILGEEVNRFENNLAKYFGVKYAVGLASGTDALTLAIKSLGLGKDDMVLLPANVYPTVFGVALAGVKVQLCDVDPVTLNIDLENIQKSVTKKTRAIVAVHLYGNPVDIAPIKAFAKKNNLFLIEDCAQAVGAVYKNKPVGRYGDVACFSFYPTKNLGAYGDAGAVITNQKQVYEKLKLLRMYGETERYNSVMVGHNSRLDELQASILNLKLKYLKKWNRQRRCIADLYKEGLSGLPLEFVEENPLGKSNFHLFVIKTDLRDELSKYLQTKGISTGIHYPLPIHLTKTFIHLPYKKSFPVSEKEAKRILSLPIHPFLTEEEIKYVIFEIKNFFGKKYA